MSARLIPATAITTKVILTGIMATAVCLAALASPTRADEHLDVALRMAQYDLDRSRRTDDPRDLVLADEALAAWVREPDPSPEALVLRAQVQQSRHDFGAALATLDRALALRPTDPQAWLTRINILRVTGLYAEAGAACQRFGQTAQPALAELCRQSLRGLNGELAPAYVALSRLPDQDMQPADRVWRDSELADMAVRLGRDADAERWFLRALQMAPADGDVRAAYADLLLRQRRAPQVLALLRGRSNQKPLLLRVAIAQKMLGDPGLGRSRAALQAAFDAETARGDAMHRRDRARFLLEVQQYPQLALAAARENWTFQREPDDVLIFVNSAASAGAPQAAKPALDFVRSHRQIDARLRTGSLLAGGAIAAIR